MKRLVSKIIINTVNFKYLQYSIEYDLISFYWLQPKPLLCKSKAGRTDCEGTKSYHKVTVVCCFSKCLYKIWPNFMYSYFINPNTFAVAGTGVTHVSPSARAQKNLGQILISGPLGPWSLIPPSGFFCFPSHNLTTDPRYISSIFRLFLFLNQEYLAFGPKAVGASEQKLSIHLPHHIDQGSLWPQLRKAFAQNLAPWRIICTYQH